MDIREVLNNLLIMADECKKRGMSVDITVGCASTLAYDPYADDDDDEE